MPLVRVTVTGWLLLGCISTAPLAAQQWDDSTVTALVARGIAARQQTQPDTSLVSYQTRAHGFVFFLAQAGRSLEGTPRLIKADELDVEVYWHAPATSKQRILGWRDGRWLPTDINYHRDHLGIVTSNFGDLIRLGDGDEVLDVPHPLSPAGPGLYQFRLRDSVEIQGRDRPMRLLEVEVRPRDPAAPRVIGTLSLEVESGALVRFRFGFTPAAYRERSLEDISVVLENAQVDRRWWLPWRQEIEIRRKVTWFDFPARSIIRGRWEIGEYDLNVAISPQALRGPAIGGLVAPRPDSTRWTQPLADAVRDAGRPVEQQDLKQVRAEVDQLLRERLHPPPRLRPGVPAVSDLLRVNRVQGLTLGAGAGLELSRGVELRVRSAFGTTDGRLTGAAGLRRARGSTEWSISGSRTLRDIADAPIISPLVNSMLAQEGGRDQGDYTLVTSAFAGVTHRRRLSRVGLSAGFEESRSVVAEATPAHGTYRPNPALGVGGLAIGRLSLSTGSESLDRERRSQLDLQLEGATGDRDYLRATGGVELLRPAGPGGVLLRLEGGAATAELPGYRSFAIGGWGTLPGERFRAWGGRRYALGRMEYQFSVPFPALSLGAFASTGNSIVVAPFVAAGAAGGSVSNTPWRPTAELRPVAGVALEWFQRLIRVEGGVSLRTGEFGLTVDVAREWWEIL
jgi:hypothetical protein